MSEENYDMNARRLRKACTMCAGMCVMVVLMMAVNGCGRCPQLVPTTANLYVGDSVRLSVKDGADALLFSRDSFVASVDKQTGWVKARHVGVTDIECTTTGTGNTATMVVRCSINVMPRYTYWKEPLLEWGISKDELVARLGEPTSVDDSESDRWCCWYGDTLKDATVTMYYVAWGDLESAVVWSSAVSVEEAHLYIKERYHREDWWEAGYYTNTYAEDDWECEGVEVYVGEEGGKTMVWYATPCMKIGCPVAGK